MVKPEPKNIRIVNIVVSTSFEKAIPLEKMAATLSNTEYNPEQFPGLVLRIKKPKSAEGTFTVRKDSAGVGVEKVLPIHSPLIVKIDIIKKAKVKRAKLYFTRHNTKRLKEKKVV